MRILLLAALWADMDESQFKTRWDDWNICIFTLLNTFF